MLKGYNGCFFAYGQTGSGKSYSMFGEESMADPALRGVIPRTLEYLFSSIKQQNLNISSSGGKGEIEVTCSFLEIYNDKIRDLGKISSSSQSEEHAEEEEEEGKRSPNQSSNNNNHHPLSSPSKKTVSFMFSH